MPDREDQGGRSHTRREREPRPRGHSATKDDPEDLAPSVCGSTREVDTIALYTYMVHFAFGPISPIQHPNASSFPGCTQLTVHSALIGSHSCTLNTLCYSNYPIIIGE